MTTRPRLTRRRFLRLAAIAGLGAALVAVDRSTQPFGLLRFTRWGARGRLREWAGKPATVALARCPSYDDVLPCLRELWRDSAMPDVGGKRVLVKPNLIDVIEGHPVTTSPEVVAAVLDILAEMGAGEVIVGDGPGFRRDAQSVVKASGLASVLATRGTRFVDFNYDSCRAVPVRDGWFPREKEVWLPRHVLEADLIVSVPKVKTHHWAGVSLSLKNLFGIVPGSRYGWPKNMLHVNGIPLSILGLYEIVRPVVAVMDGIVGMEGDGPLFGAAVPHGVLAAGADPVAVDTICAGLMGYELEEVDHLFLAAWAGVGQAKEIEVRGANRDALKRTYARPPKPT
jgi:uncharacterized protein (DUF362 family)